MPLILIAALYGRIGRKENPVRSLSRADGDNHSAELHAPGRRPCPGRPPGEEATQPFRMVGDASLATGEEED